MAHGDTRGQGDRYATADERVAVCPIACVRQCDATLTGGERTHAKATLDSLLTHALSGVDAQARIVLETVEGNVVVFLTDPARCLDFAWMLQDAVRARSEPSLRLQTGLHYGPVRLVQTHPGEPQFDGDGLEAGWRIVARAQCEIAASASFVEVIGKQSPRYQNRFTLMKGPGDARAVGEALYACSVAAPLPVHTEPPAQSEDESFGDAPDETRWGAARRRMQGLNRPARATALAVLLVLVLAVLLRQSLPSAVEQVETRPQGSSGAAQSPQPAPTKEQPAGLDSSIASVPADSATKQGSTAKPAAAATAPAASEVPVSPAAEPLPEPPAASRAGQSPAAAPALGASASLEPGANAAVRAVPPPAQARRQPAATGAVRLSVVPWGEIYVDGHRLGAAPPLRDIALQPGTHRIEVRNPGFAAYSQVIEIRAGEEIRIRHRFE